MRLFLFFTLLFPLAVQASEFQGERAIPARHLCAEQFRAIFHDISSGPTNVTTRRKEYRVAVHQGDADAFFSDVIKILGDQRQRDPAKRRLQMRDVPASPDLMFITDTDYVRNFIGTGAQGEELHRARIRKRKYVVVPRGTTVEQLARIPKDQWVYSKIADGPELRAKLELKVGNPMEEAESGEWLDQDGVVDKPGIVMRDSDIDLLWESPSSFRTHRDAIVIRAKAETLTREGVTYSVNRSEDVEEIIRRIGWLHEQGWPEDEIKPQTNMQYARTAWKITFPVPGDHTGKTFEVQITFDGDMVQTYLKSGNVDRAFPIDRVIELKIPVEYADLDAATLIAAGLGELSKIRDRYENLQPLDQTKRNSGKRSNVQRRGARLRAFDSPIVP